MKSLWISIVLLLSFITGLAISASAQDQSDEQTIIEIAKKRLYLGGVDEQDLEVQTILIKPPKVFGEEEAQEQEQQEEF